MATVMARVGESLPTLASDSKLPLRAQELRQVVVAIQQDTLPVCLSAHGAEAWKDGKSLLEHLKGALPFGKKGKASRQIPQCLILDAKDMNELLIVVNYWLHLNTEARQRAFAHLQTIYERPSSSNDRLQGADDTHDLLSQNAQSSHAAKAAKKSRNRNSTDPIENARLLVGKPVRTKFALMERYLNDLMRMTVHQLSSFYEVCLVMKRDVQTPQKGKTAESDICLPYHKTLVIARNEEKLRAVFGDAYVNELKEQEHVTYWYFDEKHEETYSDHVMAKRKADKIRTSEETREQSDF